MKRIQTKLTMRASAELQKQIESELDIPDPDKETAKAVLNEDSEGNDRTGSDRDDNEGS
jgi:hypothetical protein